MQNLWMFMPPNDEIDKPFSETDRIVKLVRISDSSRVRGHFTESLLEWMIENSTDAIAVCNLAGEILAWNREAESKFEYTAAEIIGRKASVLAIEEKRQQL